MRRLERLRRRRPLRHPQAGHKKFTDRKTSIARIRKAIQALTPTPAQQAALVAPKKAKTTKGATNKVATPTVRDGSKRAMVLELIRRADGPAFRRSWP